MTKVRTLAIAAFLGAFGLAALPTVASAAAGFATGDVNLRAGPGTGFARIVVVPAGAPLQVYSCSTWCQVNFGGYVGWVSARYVASGAYYRRPPPFRYHWRSYGWPPPGLNRTF